MMKWSIWLFVFFGALAAHLPAQNDLPVLMTEVGKGVKYAAANGAAWEKLKTPGVATTSGRLKMGGKSSITLYCNGEVKTLEGKGEYALSELFAAQRRADLTEWEKTFNDFLTAAAPAGKPFGQSLPADNAPIQTLGPVAGPVATFDLHFYWRTKTKVDSLQLEILDAEGKVVYGLEANGAEATVDPRKARLFPGADYSWRVYSANQPAMASKAKTFQMATLGQKSLLLPKLQEEKSYQEAKPFVQTLMEAAYYEREGWYYDAHESYRTLLEKESENALYQLFYGAFLRRCGISGE